MPESDSQPRCGSTWVFGYGSLVDPASLGRTLERPVTAGVDFLEADLTGWGRRWNYGVGHVSGTWRTSDGRMVDDGVIVALGLIASRTERVNGIVARVSDLELAALDVRERDYDRVDVTDAVTVSGGVDADDRIVTYVPRPSAVQRYEAGPRGRSSRHPQHVLGARRRRVRRARQRAVGPLPIVHP